MLDKTLVRKLYFEDNKNMLEITKMLNCHYYDIFNIIYYDKLGSRQYDKLNYGKDQSMKQAVSLEFAKSINAKTILDVYAGRKSMWKDKGYRIVTNDIDKTAEVDFHMDADKFVSKIYSEKKKFDIVDLDPYGSAFQCIPTAVKLIKKGLIVSYGDYNNWRFHRYKIIVARYGNFKDIKNYKDFEDVMILHTMYLAEVYGKVKLEIWKFFKTSNNFFRVYYKIKEKINWTSLN